MRPRRVVVRKSKRHIFCADFRRKSIFQRWGNSLAWPHLDHPDTLSSSSRYGEEWRRRKVRSIVENMPRKSRVALHRRAAPEKVQRTPDLHANPVRYLTARLQQRDLSSNPVSSSHFPEVGDTRSLTPKRKEEEHAAFKGLLGKRFRIIHNALVSRYRLRRAAGVHPRWR